MTSSAAGVDLIGSIIRYYDQTGFDYSSLWARRSDPAFHLRGALPAAPTVALNAVAIYLMFTVMHDSVHRTAHRSRFMNATLGRISGFVPKLVEACEYVDFAASANPTVSALAQGFRGQ